MNVPNSGAPLAPEQAFALHMQVSYEELVAARALFHRPLEFWRFSPIILVPCGLGAMALAIEAWRAGRVDEAALWALAAAIGAPALAFLLFRFGRGFFHGFRKPLFARQKVIDAPLEVVFQQSGIYSATLARQHLTPWSDLIKLCDNEAGYYFITAKNILFLPARAVPENQRDDFRAAIRLWSGLRFERPEALPLAFL